jgi:Cu(I)/Ag(I) efflux system membrane protein CusA/SilA
MIAKIIEFSVRNRWLVIITWLGIAIWGVYAVLHTPVDAIPDLSENQVIVFTDWMGRSPQDIEEQITYPLSVQLQGLAGVKAIRSSSEFNFSMINIIFDEKTDFYFARTRVLERLAVASTALPGGVTPYLAPDATALGQIFWYTVEGEGKSLDELRAIQDYTVRYALNSIPGVAEVASVGGFVREYQVDVDPSRLRLFDLPLSTVFGAIASSNMSVGGKVVVSNNSEYAIRGVGWLQGVKDLENVVVTSRGGVPILLKNLATVQLGPEFRRSALEKNGAEAVGGVVMMRYGQNPLEVTRLIKEKIRDMQSGLPQGVRIVPFYDRTRLIESAIHTVTGTLREEIIIATIAILLILTHVRSAFVVCITLPLAALISFLFMYYLNIPSNIMSLSGIAISIGILVDAAVVMVENATHELKEKFGTEKVAGDTTEIVVRACRLVGRPIFFSVVIMLISFLPVFAFSGQEGKLSHPLAYTKSFAMIGVAILAITLVPAIIPLFIRGRLKREDENWIVRSFINIYKPLLSWVIDRPGFVWWLMGAILSLGAGFIQSSLVASIVLALGLCFILLGVKHLRWRIIAATALIAIAFLADTRFRKLGGEFMPSLNEGTIMDMPQSAPRIAMAEAVDDVMVRDRLIRSFPEVEQAVGKIGRADTATDPSPVDMVETIVNLQPREFWPKRLIRFEDAMAQADVVVDAMQKSGSIKLKDGKLSNDLLNTATMVAIEKFDRSMRELARMRQMEFEPALAKELTQLAADMFRKHNGVTASIDSKVGIEHGILLAQLPRQEEVDKLLQAIKLDAVSKHLVEDRGDLLIDRPETVRDSVNFLRRAVGGNPPDFSQRVFEAIEARRIAMWVERTRILNWELADNASAIMNDVLIDSLLKTVAGTEYAGAKPQPDARAQVRASLDKPLQKNLMLWQKSKDDILKEMDSELQMPGWGNVWTQPIINRVNMLATGVRTQIGVKIYGPSNKPLTQAIEDVQRVSTEIAQKLKSIPGAVDVNAEQAVGKRYLEIYIDREKAARYGINMADIGEAIETALGGQKVTQTVEGRQRFPVRLRYAREYWQDADRIGDVLVTARTSPVELLKMESSSAVQSPPKQSEMNAKSQAGSGAMGKSEPSVGMPEQTTSVMQIPLRMVADIRVVEGPSMIKSENGRLRNYVTLNVRERDIVGFVDEARQAVKPIEATLAGTGMSVEWTGEFENQVRARQTMAVIFPMVVVLIMFLLYLTFRDILDMLLVSLAVVGALAGSVMFQAAFGFNFSVIVSIGYVAAFGMATQTGVIMLVYLREAIDRKGGLSAIKSLEELRELVIKGAVHRLRPKLLTEGVAIVGLVPMLWATGTGAEIMRPMAAPVLGGLLISDEVIDLMIPVLFYWIRRARWKKLHGEQPNDETRMTNETRSPNEEVVVPSVGLAQT